MTERPILMSGPMVRAILEGRKTQTRRVVKPQPEAVGDAHLLPLKIDCPYGQPGDRLWVREGFCMQQGKPIFRADAVADDSGDRRGWWVKGRQHVSGEVFVEGPLDWKPSIHMPRAICRIVLELTAVRVERLQEISEADAKAEGAHVGGATHTIGVEPNSFRCGFWSLWDSLNAKRAPWASNPWVWVLKFRIAAPANCNKGEG